KLGARAHITECGGDWTFDGPKYHYLQAIQWDVNADIDAVMEDFCRYSYGKAAGVMRKFWDRLEEVYEKRRPLPYGMINRRFLFYQWVGWQQATYLQPNDELQEYTLQDVGFLDKCIAEAAGLAANDTEGVQFRLQRLSDAWKYYRTMLVSYLEYFNVALAPQVASGQSRDAALKLAREITDLRTSRNFYLGKLRAYRHGINPRMAKRYYWSSASGMTLFSHERTLLDELCTAVSGHIKKSGGVEAALKFWRKIPSSDSLSETARTQIYVLSHTALPDLLANGDFEDGTLDAWQVSGAVKIVRGKARNGTHCVEMTSAKSTLRSQRLPVSPQERYRLSVWVKHLTAPVGTTTPLEVITRLRNGEKQQYREPLRCMLRTRDPADGWVRLNNTLTVSPGADNIEITIKKKFKGTVLLDDVKLERIKGGPRIEPGTLSDTFTGDRIDRNKWFQATSSGGTEAPKVAGGWLVYSGSNMLYPLTAYAAFNDLIEH
ncbi:MAG: carbohydrate binding domain-containing protein, partial [Phycisphaerae bacterium]|nr:carbohydrate binding domain-containing protein [Phycisphaerae bacterium]